MERAKMIAAGFGFRTSATFESFKSAFEKTISADELFKLAVIAVPQDKVNHKSLIFFAKEIGCEIWGVKPLDIERMQTKTHSSISKRFRNTGSVSEACALVAAGSEAELVVSREISIDRRATCSLAKGK